MEFERLEKELFRLLKALHEKKRQYDKACSDCHILLRPWPKKSAQKADGEDSGKSDSKDDGSQLNPKEEEELKVVNDVLSKAVKARKKMMSKTLASEQDAASGRKREEVVQEQDGSPPGLEKQLWEVCDSDDADGSARHTSMRSSIQTSGNEIRKTHAAAGNSGTKTEMGSLHDVSVQKDSSRPRTEDHDPKASKPSVSIGSKLQSAELKAHIPRTTSEDLQRSRSSNSARSLHTADRRPKSGQGKVKPAHMRAPFKTQPHMPAPKHQIKKSAPSVAHGRSRRNAAAVEMTHNRGHGKVLPPIETESSEVRLCLETDSKSHRGDRYSEGMDGEENACEDKGSCPKGDYCVAVLAADVSEMALSNKAENQVATTPCVSADQPDTVKSAKGDPCNEFFHLQENGASINIPPNVKRAFGKNEQLRQKLQQRQKNPCNDHSNMGQSFVSKLEELFDCDEELAYRQKARRCLHAHRRLLTAIEDLRLNELTDLSCLEDVLRAKLMVEFILSFFSMMSEESDLLSKIQFLQSDDLLPDCGAPEAVQLLHTWFPSDYCDRTTACTGAQLSYSSSQLLRRYLGLQLQVQNLKCQLHLTRLFISDLFPGLERERSAQDGACILRGIFSLATSCGEYSPALVHAGP